jgi:hypothetical protein
MGRLMLLGNARSQKPPMKALMKSDQTKQATPKKKMPKMRAAIKTLSGIALNSFLDARKRWPFLRIQRIIRIEK